MSETFDMETVDADRGVEERSVDSEMKRSYLEYAMSVIVGRALPDARDGLKPVQRRVLYTMHKSGNHHNRPFVKSANIVGRTMGEHHPHGDSAIYDTMVRMAQDWQLRVPLVDGQGNWGCFTGDTTIRLLNGKDVTFEELSKLPSDEIFYVYSVDAEGKIVVGEGRNARITRHQARLVKVTLDDGVEIRCTPDHRFMLRDGSYLEAQHLDPTHSLMPGYFDEARISGVKNNSTYLRIMQPDTCRYEWVHHLADRYNFDTGRALECETPWVRHHADFDRYNNAPSNIVRMNFHEHLMLHAAHISALWAQPEFRAAQRAGVQAYYAAHPEAVEANRQRLQARNRDPEFIEYLHANPPSSRWTKEFFEERPELREEISRRTVALWADPEWRTKTTEALRGRTMNLTKEQREALSNRAIRHNEAMWNDPQTRESLVAAIRAAHRTDEYKAAASERSRAQWQDPEYRNKYPEDHFSAMALALWADPATREAHSEKMLKQWEDLEFREAFSRGRETDYARRVERDPECMNKLAARAGEVLKERWTTAGHREKVLRSRIAGFVHQASQGRKSFTAEDFESARAGKGGVPRYENALAYFEDHEEMLEAARAYNHRIESIEWLDETEDVYDITVDEHHNFLLSAGVFVHNSRDGDSAAAYRYSEARMTSSAAQLLRDIDQETVDWVDNYDGQHQEPSVLPARFPALLVNGAAGIAVGMATQIPPHNLREVAAAVAAMIDEPDIDVAGLMQHIAAPDMPTGGLIVGRAGIRQAYETGRGRLVVRGVTHVEQRGGGRERIIVTELPYTVQKGDGRGDGSGLIMKIVELVNDKKIPEIVDVRDESGKDIRLVIDLRAGSIPQVVLNKLYKHTSLQLTTGINMVALHHGQPQTMNLVELLRAYLDHQIEVVTRRTRYQLNKARARAHLLEGLLIALDALDRVIEIIRGSDTQEAAEKSLIDEIGLSKVQAGYVLERQLRQLTSLNIEGVRKEHTELTALIAELRALLGDERAVLAMVKEEVEAVAEAYGDERRSVVIPGEDDFDVEDLIPETLSVVMLTEAGYLKRVSLDEFRAQSRGGVGSKGVDLQDADDRLKIARVVSTHEWLLAFTNRGRLWRLRGWQVPEGGRGSKGRSLANLLPLESDERIVALCNTREFDDRSLVFATRKGVVKRTLLSAYDSVYKTVSLRAIGLQPGDELVGVRIAEAGQSAIVLSHRGRAQRFAIEEVRQTGRISAGVRAMRLTDDHIVSLSIHDPDGHLLLVTEDGFGKRVPMSEFRIRHRGGMGVRAIPEGSRGAAVAGMAVEPEDELLVITRRGMVQRLSVDAISSYSRSAKGIRVMRLVKDDAVTLTCIVSARELAQTQPEASEGSTTSDEPRPRVVASVGDDNEASEAMIEALEAEESAVVELDGDLDD